MTQPYFAGPSPAVTDTPSTSPMRGSNHEGMRQFNERIVLQTIRLHGPLPKAELARLTQLSKQTVSVIVEKLLADGLLLKQDRIRGGIGQPSVPLALNPDGAYSLGIQVGRRSLELLLVDFCGRAVRYQTHRYDVPDPRVILPLLQRELSEWSQQLGHLWPRMVGVGLAAPLAMEQWADVLGPSVADALQHWQGLDLRQTVQAMTSLPVIFTRDTVAACAAELLLGRGRQIDSFLYIYVGTFLGGGVVLQGRLLTGPRGNAGAIGSLPVGLSQKRPAPQLLEVASGWHLELALRRNGQTIEQTSAGHALPAAAESEVQAWLQRCANGLAMAAINAAALLDLDAVIVDGSIPSALLERLVVQTQQALADYRTSGIQCPRVWPGSVGAHARALGGALLPQHAHFFPDRDIFVKSS